VDDVRRNERGVVGVQVVLGPVDVCVGCAFDDGGGFDAVVAVVPDRRPGAKVVMPFMVGCP
jgi:hypothetical protein